MRYINNLLALVLLCSSCQGEKESETMPQYSVKVTKPEHVEFASSVHSYPFIIKPYNESELSFRISGPLNNFNLKSGDFFKKGEVILSVDQRDFKVRRQQAAAILAQKEEEYHRVEVLYRAENISKRIYEKAKSDYLVAQSNYQVANNALSDTQIRAPFDGFIQTVNVEPFEEVNASQQVVTFIELDRLKAEVYIPEEVARSSFSPSEAGENPLRLYFDAKPTEPLYPQHVEVSKSTTSNNLSYKLTAVIANQDHQLLGGMSGKLVIDSSSDSSGKRLTIPRAALCHNRALGDYVWRVENGVVSRAPIKLGRQLGTRFEVLDGLDGETEVALTRKSFLSENLEVNSIK